MRSLVQKPIWYFLFAFSFFIQPNNGYAGALIQESDLMYLGAFRVPQGNYNGISYGYSGHGLMYYPPNNSLFMNGINGRNTAEFSIPVPVDSDTLPDLNIATSLQAWEDITEGNRDNIGEGGEPCIGNGNWQFGLFYYNEIIYGTVWAYYDGAYCAKLSHFTSEVDLSQTGDFDGMYRVGDDTYDVSIKAGYMCEIPSEWQSSFGGAPALTGRCFDPVLGRSSFGPCVSTFYPDSVGVVEPSPSTTLVHYESDSSRSTLGGYVAGHNGASPNPYISPADRVGGIIFAEGTDTVLFIGMHGAGEWCYKCPMPNNPAGNGAYPYEYFVWAYDANDLAASFQGDYTVTQDDYDNSRFWDGVWPDQVALAVGETVEPWNVVPYDAWALDTPIFPSPEQIHIPSVRGATFDPTTKRIYMAAYGVDGGNDKPLIHVFQIGWDRPGTPTGLSFPVD